MNAAKRIAHALDPEIAIQVGPNAGLIYGFIRHFCAAKEAEEDVKSFHDGRYWIFNSISGFARLFPYLSEKQIRSALQVLEDGKFIISGNFNKAKFDRTKWYSDLRSPVCPQGQIDMVEKGELDLPSGADYICPTGQTNTIDTIETIESPPKSPKGDDRAEGDFEIIWHDWPRKVGTSKAKALTAFKRLSKRDRNDCFEGAINFAAEQTERIEKNPSDERFCPHLVTFINQRRWETLEIAA